MTSWRDDKRFQCPLCGSLIQMKFLYRPESMPEAKGGILAACFTCECVFSMDDWRAARLDPEETRRRHREYQRRLRMNLERRRNAANRGPIDEDDLPF